MRNLFYIFLYFQVSLCSFAQTSIDRKQLDILVDNAEKTNSNALIVYSNGKPYYSNYFGRKKQKIDAMSSTKSIVSLAIGKLITDNLIHSVDQFVYEFYPEWNQNIKKEITIRHLLNHTSGLQNYPNTAVEIYPSKNFIKLALDAEVIEKPGTTFRYNNKAVNLLAGIVKKATGKKLDLYLKETLFNPMGITDFDWSQDKSGNPQGMAGFQVYPEDLAKIGQLVINKGNWNGKQLINESWFTEISKPSALEPTCGLLWWIQYKKRFSIVDDDQILKLKNIGFPDIILEKLAELKGRYTETEFRDIATAQILTAPFWKESYLELLQKNTMSLSRKEYSEIIGYSTRGSYGNYMFVSPSKNIVVVRMITELSSLKSNDSKSDFVDFFNYAGNLTQD